jgi:hypothetical protein
LGELGSIEQARLSKGEGRLKSLQEQIAVAQEAAAIAERDRQKNQTLRKAARFVPSGLVSVLSNQRTGPSTSEAIRRRSRSISCSEEERYAHAPRCLITACDHHGDRS